MRQVEIGGGKIVEGAATRLLLPPTGAGYCNAQLDDYGGLSRRQYRHRPKTTLSLTARFSHNADQLVGTAGFGFWNAPLGDPTVRTPALPSAAWFFFASEPNRLPFLRGQTGWFAATIDVRWVVALGLLPVVVPVTLGNWFRPIQRKIWPPIERLLGISATPITQPMSQWHHYQIEWLPESCRFCVDQATILETPTSPHRPLGFVCWIDNQYMIATPHGRFGAGLLTTQREQWLEAKELRIG